MSIYTYKCEDCGNKSNIEATIEEKEAATAEKFVCQKCGSKKITNHFSAANFLKNIFSKDEDCGCSSEGNSCCGGSSKDKDSECCSDQKNNSCCGK